MAKSILRAGKIAGVVIVAIIVVAAVLHSAGVLSVAQTQLPPPETTGSAEPTSDVTLAEQKKLVIACLAGDEPGEAVAAMDLLLTDFAQDEQLPSVVHGIVQKAVKAGKYEAVGEVCRALADNPSAADNGVWIAMVSALAAVYQKDDAALDAATGHLTANYSGDLRSIEVFREIAYGFRQQKKYARARQSYQHVVDTWPNGPGVVFSQRGLVLANLALDDMAAADAALDELLSGYAQDGDLVECAATVARAYRNKKQFDTAAGIYEFIAENRADHPKAIWLQLDLFSLVLVKLKDEAQADAAYATLVERFGGHEEIAKVVNEVAWAYRKQKKYADSLRVYGDVLANWPDSDSALVARQGIVLSLIGAGDAEGAAAEVAGLLVDYAGDKRVVGVARKLADEFRKKKLYESAIGIYEFIADNRADHPKAIWLQLDLFNTVLVKFKDDARADAAYATLLERFGGHEDIARVAGEAAWTYRKQKKYADSLRVYHDVLANWPDSESALIARRGIVLSLIGLADAEGADAEAAALLADYEGAEGVVGAALKMAEEFRKKKLYESARRLYEYAAANRSDGKQAIVIQRKVVTTNIGLGDEDGASAALESLRVGFADDKQLAGQVYEVGEYYRKRKNYARARGVYQSVIEDWPGTAKAMWSSQRCIVMDIDLLDDPNDPQPQIPGEILLAADDLITNYGEQKEMVRALLYAGEIYHRRAFVKDPSGFSAEALVEFAKASAIFAKIISEAPVHAKYTGDAHYMTAVGLGRAGRYEEAIAHHQAVMDNWPKHHLAYSSLYWIGSFQQSLRAQGLLTAAEADSLSEQAFLRLFEKYPNTPTSTIKRVRSELAKIYRRAKRWEDVISIYEPVIQDLSPEEKVPQSAFYLARAYEGMGQKEMALQMYRKVLQDWPGQSWTVYAETAIEKLEGQAGI
jgi:tetratricopeptide (TPR) repeat protein